MKSSTFVIETIQGSSGIDAAYLLSQTRHVPVEGTISSENIDWIITQCELLIQQDDSPITLYFNSTGGSLYAAYHLIDYIHASNISFNGVATEICASAAAQIFASLPKGHRLIMDHAHILIHQPLTSAGAYINSNNIKDMTKFLEKTEQVVYNDLAEWTGQTVEKITNDCAKETWLQGPDAISYGIADELYTMNALKKLEEGSNE